MSDDGAETLFSTVSCSVVRAGWFRCDPEWQLPERVMPDHILWICVGGGADLVLGDAKHRLEPGCALIAPPHVRQRGAHDPRNPLEVYSVHFVARLYGVLDAPLVFGLPVILRLSDEHLRSAVEAAKRIIAELLHGETAHSLITSGDCSRLLALLCREHAAQNEGLTLRAGLSGGVARLAPALRLVDASYAEPLTLGDMASSVHLHPAYFSVLFKRVTGMPPSRYLAQRRLHRVQELLLATELPIHQIAALTGFRDPFYLSRVFQHEVGVSPSGYRRRREPTGAP